MKKGKVWLNVTLNEEKQIVGFSITDAGAFEEKNRYKPQDSGVIGSYGQ